MHQPQLTSAVCIQTIHYVHPLISPLVVQAKTIDRFDTKASMSHIIAHVLRTTCENMKICSLCSLCYMELYLCTTHVIQVYNNFIRKSALNFARLSLSCRKKFCNGCQDQHFCLLADDRSLRIPQHISLQ